MKNNHENKLEFLKPALLKILKPEVVEQLEEITKLGRDHFVDNRLDDEGAKILARVSYLIQKLIR